MTVQYVQHAPGEWVMVLDGARYMARRTSATVHGSRLWEVRPIGADGEGETVAWCASWWTLRRLAPAEHRAGWPTLGTKPDTDPKRPRGRPRGSTRRPGHAVQLDLIKWLERKRR